MKQNLKIFFAELAGVDPSQIETSLDDEDFDMEGADDEEIGEEDGFEIPDFIRGASNIYRTREFIVKQVISLAHHGLDSAKLISTDTYYLRTPGRDACYEGIFGENKDPDGKRIPTMAYFRSYRT